MRRIAVALVLVLIACTGDDAPPTGSESTSRPATGELRYYLPTGETGETSTHPGPDPDRGGFAIVLGRPDGEAFVDVVRVFGEESDTDREVAANEQEQIEDVDVNGITARRSVNPVIGASVDWFADGWLVGVSGPESSADVVLAVARSLDVEERADGLGAVPDGYEVLGAFSSEGTPSPSWRVDYVDGAETMSIDGSLVPVGTTPVVLAGIGERIEPIVVRGVDGIMSTSSTTFEGMPEIVISTIAWLERPDLMITVQGSVSVERMLAAAESLREVTEAEFSSS